jgi:hypothetical protein
MRTAIFLLVIISPLCYGQNDYQARLSARLAEARKLEGFDNGVVVYHDSSSYGYDFPRWMPAQDYYQDDIVTFKGGTTYRALAHSKGKDPARSPENWKLLYGPHPYFFLRDTAKTEDLKALLASDHPYLRTYAFAALAHRKYDGLFQIILNNLKDTTRIALYTGDVGYSACPADLMMQYTVHEFSVAQKDLLKKLILTQHTHLNTLQEALLFHKPRPDEYQYVKEIAKKDTRDKIGLIALAKYRRTEDIELIRTGFKNSGSYRVHDLFFLAIENFPDQSFKNDLLDHRAKIKTDCRIIGHDHYYRSLAALQDVDCFKILEAFADQKCDDTSYNPYEAAGRIRNLKMIGRALKDYYTPMYDGMIVKIEREVSGKTDSALYQYARKDNPWHY